MRTLQRMTQKVWILPIGVALLLTGCATIPTGPSVLVLPGTGKDFEEFKVDDAVCRQWALRQTGTTTQQASADATTSCAAIGTALGAAGGAAAGSPATGAAVGAGVGLLGGTAAGAEAGEGAEWSVQHRYDMAYMQCMYAKGNQIPVPAGVRTQSRSTGRRASVRPPADIPPPPPGSPPPPPPGLGL